MTRHGFATSVTDYCRMSSWVRAFGGEWCNPEDPTDFVGDQPNTVEAMTFLQEMIWQDQSTLPGANRGDFAAGAVPMMEQMLNSAVTFRDVAEVGEAGRVAAEATAALDWGVVPLPMEPNGRKTRTGDDGIAIWSGTQHPDALRYSRISIHG